MLIFEERMKKLKLSFPIILFTYHNFEVYNSFVQSFLEKSIFQVVSNLKSTNGSYQDLLDDLDLNSEDKET